jgi:tetratricopeptide (TPR) repeat protein
MKRILFTLSVVLTINLQAQLNLNFNKRYVECEDKWIVFNLNKDSTYKYGFIYIDASAGLTFNYEGSFKQNSEGKIIDIKKEETNLKYRLEPNNVEVAIIPENLYKDLLIDTIPEWLQGYKTDINTAKRQYKWGYMYNGWNECAKALPFLLRAKEIDPHYEGLAVEIAFSYNCLKEYSKAAEILESAIKINAEDAYINKELIYSLVLLNAENCVNIMQYFYMQKDKEKFMLWYDELKKWPTENKEISKYAELWLNQLK